MKSFDIIDGNDVGSRLLLHSSGTATTQRILRLNLHYVRIRVVDIFLILDVIIVLNFLYVVALFIRVDLLNISHLDGRFPLVRGPAALMRDHLRPSRRGTKLEKVTN